MCGIAGYVSRSTNAVDRGVIEQMTSAVEHRGPDGSGIWLGQGVALGHRRLAIIDLSDLGSQPMIDPDSGRVIVFNGEIYNYIEIRRSLSEHGYRFRSNSDTEVILKAYDFWGDRCVEQFNGMWAFALYDPRLNNIFCSRDRFGVKPFYFSDIGSALIFGSEIRQLAPLLPGCSANTEVLLGFISHRVAEPLEETFFSGIRKLPGGHNLMIEAVGGAWRVVRYYSLGERKNLSTLDTTAAAEQFKTIFQSAVELRLRSDVRVGTCLSGGLDSSSIATIAARSYRANGGGKFSAITVLGDDPGSDESQFARAVVDREHLDWIALPKCYRDFQKAMISTVRAQEEPFAGASVVMQYFVMEAARGANIPVLLDGQGADEALLGYERYFADYCIQLLASGQVSELFGYLIELRRNGRQGIFKAMLWNALYFYTKRFKHAVMFRDDRIFKQPFRSAFRKDVGYSRRSSASLFEMQTEEIERNSLPALLRYEDKNSMWHSIETRLPFLDYRVVEFALSLSASVKLKGGWGKRVLREAMKDELPAEVSWRKVKFGFEAPESKWMAEHAKAVHTAIQSSDLLGKLCIEARLDDAGIERLHPGIRWRLFVAALWAENFGISSLG
jgi:asparagine synthase (glutamine-hydrolysing)